MIYHFDSDQCSIADGKVLQHRHIKELLQENTEPVCILYNSTVHTETTISKYVYINLFCMEKCKHFPFKLYF